mgnify:CR=1 FL=1
MTSLKKIQDGKIRDNIIKIIARKKEIPVFAKSNEKMFTGKMKVFDFKGEKVGLYFPENISGNKNIKQLHVNIRNKEGMICFNTAINTNRKMEAYYLIKRPSKFYTSFRRKNIRCELDNEEVQLIIKNHAYTIKNISIDGCSFISKEMILPANSKIRNAKIMAEDSNPIYIDGKIKNVRFYNGQYLYGVNFLKSDYQTYNNIFSLIFSKNYPSIKLLDDFSNQDIYDVFVKSGYISSYFEGREEECKEKFDFYFKAREKTKNKMQILFNIGYLKNEELLTIGSALKIYNNTYMGQHLVSIKKARFNIKSKIDIYAGISDFILSRKDFKYYISYFYADMHWHNEMFKRFSESLDDKKSIFDDFIFLEITTENFKSAAMNFHKKYFVEPSDDISPFVEYCRNNLSEIERKCYGYTKNEFNQDNIKQIYEVAGLYLNRILFKVSEKEKTVAYVVAEVYTSGLNIYNILDTARILIVDKNAHINDIVKSASDEIIAFYQKYNKKSFGFMCTNYKDGVESVDIEGVDHTVLFNRIIGSRRGCLEYRQLLLSSIK